MLLTKPDIIFVFSMIVFLVSCSHVDNNAEDLSDYGDFPDVEDKVVKTDEEWKKILSKEVYYVMREKGTERAFSGKYYKHKEEGTYICAACGNPLFSSDAKFESGTGWPSFYKPFEENRIEIEKDYNLGMERTEVHCARCGGHLGHLFNDGPEPTYLRYCINSVSLKFVPQRID